MKKTYILLFCISLMGCHTGNNSVKSNGDEIIRTIHLTEAIGKTRQVFLSEIADSISFIVLDTDHNSLLGNFLNFNFTNNHIFSNNYCFDWQGMFIGKTGRRGQGPCEEPGQIITKVIFKDNHFYTIATKLIEYDSLMQCTGKERSLYRLDGDRPVDFNHISMINISSAANAKENILLYAYPDSVFFMDTAFNIISSRQALYPTLSSLKFVNPLGGQYTKYVTNYGNQTLFYNFFNDTVYYAESDHLTPAWIVELSDHRRVPDDLLYRGDELLSEASIAWQSGNLDHSELVRLTDNKAIVMAVYETSRTVFLVWNEMVQFYEIRNKKGPIPRIAFFDKQTGKTESTGENGFVDDLLDTGTYLPMWGAYNDVLIKSMWPYELHGYMDECTRSGRKINPRLLDFAQKVSPEDNPVLIVAHLKK